MNERFQELAKQVWPDPNTSHDNHMKFAELIVLKCAEIADTAEPFLSSDLIKEYFGVDK